jgi:hypothetical protein
MVQSIDNTIIRRKIEIKLAKKQPAPEYVISMTTEKLDNGSRTGSSPHMGGPVPLAAQSRKFNVVA